MWRRKESTGALRSGLLAAVLFDAVGMGSGTLDLSYIAMTPGGARMPLTPSQIKVTVQ